MLKLNNVRPSSLPPEMRCQLRKLILDSAAGPEFEKFSGANRKRGLIYFMHGDTACVRRYREPRDPKTADQRQRRQLWGQAQRYWSQITKTQRTNWVQYAYRYRKQLARQNGVGTSARKVTFDSRLGQNAYVKIQTYRLPLGLPLSTDAPIQPPPPVPFRIIQEPTTSPDSIAFRLVHSIRNPAGYTILIEITPPTQNPNRKPRETNLRWLHGPTPASFIPLETSGSLYTIPDLPNPILPGQRYGLRIRIVTLEGVPSPFNGADLIEP